MKVYSVFFAMDGDEEILCCVLTKEERAKELCTILNINHEPKPCFYIVSILDDESKIVL